MKSNRFKLLIHAGLLCLLIAAPQLSYAQELGSKGLLDYVKSVVNTVVLAFANLTYELDPSLQKTTELNIGQNLASSNANNLQSHLATCAIYQSFYNVFADKDKDYANNPGLVNLKKLCGSKTKFEKTVQTVNELAPIIATDSLSILPKSNTSINLLPGFSLQSFSSEKGNLNFNFYELFSKTVYTEQEYKQAINYINFIGRLYEPLPLVLPPKNSTDNQSNFANSPSYQAYQVALRSLVAKQSLALNALYHIVAERVSQSNLQKLNLVDRKGNPISSPLQLNQYIASHRADDPTWYQQITTASPATLAREQVIILAAIQRQLFQLHIDNEQNAALLATLVFQSKEADVLQLKIKADSISTLIDEQQKAEADTSKEQIKQDVQSGTDNGSVSELKASEAYQKSQEQIQEIKEKLKNSDNSDNS